MKRKQILLPFLFLLLIACFEPQINDENPNWVLDRITLAEIGWDAQCSESIWRYIYNEQTVYYIISYFEDKYNYLYDYNGNILGAPDGGSDNLGDGRCPDFFKTSSESSLIWQDQNTTNLNTGYDYYFINTFLINAFPQTGMLVRRETLFPNHYDQIMDTIIYHNIDFNLYAMYSYDLKNSATSLLNDSLLTDSAIVISQSYIDSILTVEPSSANWNDFRNLHPDFPAYFEFALPGYDPGDTVSVFEYAIHYGYEQSLRGFALVEKINGEWGYMRNDSTGLIYDFYLNDIDP